MDVFTVGEALSCFSPVDGRLASARTVDKSVGGAEFNTAVGLARLGNSVCWCSRLGADPFGDDILQRAQREGIVTDYVSRPAGSATGLMFKDRTDPLVATTYYYRSRSAAAGLSVADLPDKLAGAKHLHVTGVAMWIGPEPEALVWRAFKTAVDSNMSVSFDPNFRSQLATFDHMRETSLRALAFTSTFLCNEFEAASITGLADPIEAATSLSGLGPATVIVKRGIDGVVAVVEGITYVLPAWPVPTPVDPVGAGDAFNAGWIHSQLHDLDPGLGLALSAYVAAQVVSHETDHDGFPSLAEVTAWLATQAKDARSPVGETVTS
jgi:2-dehydro-3-deoxygluconokinase